MQDQASTGGNGTGGIPAARLERFRAAEAARYAAGRPRAAAAAQARAGHFLGGVPMHWMRDWPLPFPPVVAEARGARLTDIDGFGIDDFCLGDTAAMFGHSPPPVARAIRRQARRGLAFMLPPEEAEEAGRLLCEVFGDYRWQVATTATDANRFALRVARAITGRPRVLVFDGSYHGTAEETMVARAGGRTVNRPGLMGQFRDLSEGAVAVDFNDLAQVEAALAAGDVAAVLAEPVMTNSGMVLPAPGFHAGLRELCTRHATLLILDETHTLSSGRGGYAAVHGLAPDILVVGKAVAGGMATAVWGLAPAVAAAHARADAARPPGHSGMGTTLSANPMQIACLVATLGQVMTPAAHARMERGAARLEAGLAAAIARHGAPWHVVRVGGRVEFVCAPGPLANGAEAARAHQPAAEAAMNLALLNRGALIAPFHNMMLVSPATGRGQIDRLAGAFDEVLGTLFGGAA